MAEEQSKGLQKYLSTMSVWGLSFGCSVGWGAFVMPGTTFLPIAGPLGTALGIAIGAVVMMIIGMNYHHLMNRYPEAGGTLTYTLKTFGYDHGFLSSWFLVLVYVAVLWANATALALIGRNLLGNLFQFGFHYRILGYDVYGGEVLISVVAILLFGLICIKSTRLAAVLQAVFAVVLFAGIVLCFIAAMINHSGGALAFRPLFSPTNGLAATQVFAIVVLSPWAFVGFESVSHTVEEFRFPVKRTFAIMMAALIVGALSYIFLAVIAAAYLPEGFETWDQYIAALPELSGLPALPAFFGTNEALGRAGLVILGITILAAIFTGIIGNFFSASRLLFAMAKERILPEWFGKQGKDGTPKNALIFLMILSLFIPLFGRTAIGWIVDVTTVGATIAYGFTSAAAFASARRTGEPRIKVTGLIGLIASVVFFFYFMAIAAGAMATESYLILAAWSILGFIYFRHVFSQDKERHFGKSTVVWMGLLFLIFFTSLLWIRNATDDMTKHVVSNISEYYEERNPEEDPEAVFDTEQYLAQQMDAANKQLTVNNSIQMALIVAALAIMFSIYTTMSKREREADVERAKAEESSKAKTVFLSNMSHDIRTPMNAIIGYINLAEGRENHEEELREYLAKIKTSSHHLLALINDVLEMSRIESGKMDLEPIAVDLKKTLSEVYDMFSTQMEEKNITFTVDSSQIRHSKIYCDKNRFNRVLLNLLSNAYKFTPEGGNVSVSAWEIDGDAPRRSKYEFHVTDSGIGMSEEFAAKVFEAFERERTSTVSGIQGTGLGMAITKSIVDLM